MAAFYADENFSCDVVEALRGLGHDVLTALEAGQANQRIPDEAVLEFATQMTRCILTHDRWDFGRLHQRVEHAGIVLCTLDPEPERQAASIDASVRRTPSLAGVLLRVTRDG